MYGNGAGTRMKPVPPVASAAEAGCNSMVMERSPTESVAARTAGIQLLASALRGTCRGEKSARGGTRTPMPCGMRPSNARVCHFTTRALSNRRGGKGARWREIRQVVFVAAAKVLPLPEDPLAATPPPKLARGEKTRLRTTREPALLWSEWTDRTSSKPHWMIFRS